MTGRLDLRGQAVRIKEIFRRCIYKEIMSYLSRERVLMIKEKRHILDNQVKIKTRLLVLITVI